MTMDEGFEELRSRLADVRVTGVEPDYGDSEARDFRLDKAPLRQRDTVTGTEVRELGDGRRLVTYEDGTQDLLPGA